MEGRPVGRLFGLGAALIWGTSPVATAFALKSFTAFGVVALRGIGTLLLMLGILAGLAGLTVLHRRHRGHAPARRSWTRGRVARLLVLAFLGGLGYVVALTVAVQLTNASVTAFLAGGYPILAAAGAPLLLGERLTLGVVLGMITAGIGVFLLSGFDAAGISPLGVGAGFAAALGGAAFLLLGRRWSRPWQLKPETIAVTNFGMLAVGGMAVALATSTSFVSEATPAAQAVVALFWLCLGAGVLANIFVVSSINRIPARESSAFLLVNPVFAALLAALLLGERLGPLQSLGALLVLIGIALATLVGSRRTELAPG